MRSDINEPLTYEWLAANGFREIERLERQPTPIFRRCIGLETVGDHWFRAGEDLCIDVSANLPPASDKWFCFLSRNHSPNRQSGRFIHIRKLRTVGDLVLLYEGLTGRQFGPAMRLANPSTLSPPILGNSADVTVLGGKIAAE